MQCLFYPLFRAVLFAGTAVVCILVDSPSAAARSESASDCAVILDSICVDSASDRRYLGYLGYLAADIIVTAVRHDYSLGDGSSGTKTPTRLIDTPQFIIALTRDQIDDQGLTRLHEALRYIAGISLESGEGHRDEIVIRGQETTADFYLDGLRDDAQYYRALYNIARIEVLKGANALIFGRGAGGGAVNRIRKRPEVGQQIYGASASADRFGAYGIAADVNSPLGAEVALRLNSTYESANNHRDAYSGRFIGIAPSLAFESATRRLVFDYSYDDDRRVTDRGIPSLHGVPLAGYDRSFFGDTDFNHARAQVHIARARLEQKLAEYWTVDATVHYGNYTKSYANILPRSSDGRVVEVSGYQDSTARENYIVQGNLVWQGSTGPIDHGLLLGAEMLWQNSMNSRANAEFLSNDGGVATSRVTVPLTVRLALPAVRLTDLTRNRASNLSVLSLYIQDQIRFADWVEIIAGLRYERVMLTSIDIANSRLLERRDSVVSPRVGVIVKPQEQISLYASYSTSFLPQAGEQFLVLSDVTAMLDPEKFTSWEVGMKWKMTSDLFLSAALFTLTRSNSDSPDPDNTGLLVQLGKSRTRGFEVSLAGRLFTNFHINAGYSYLDGAIVSSTAAAPLGRRLPQTPRHQLGIWGRYDSSAAWGIGLGLVHQSQQFASFSNRVILPRYTRVDAAIYWMLGHGVAVQLNIENLFDNRYYPSAHGDNNIAPAKPFNASLSLRLTL